MTWKDILKQDGIEKAPFGRFRRNKTPAEPKLTGNQQNNIELVKQRMQHIVTQFKNDPEFQKAGKFAIKVNTQDIPKGTDGSDGYGKKRGLVYDLNHYDGKFDVNFIATHGIPELEKLGFKVERMGDMIQASKGDSNVQGKFGI